MYITFPFQISAFNSIILIMPLRLNTTECDHEYCRYIFLLIVVVMAATGYVIADKWSWDEQMATRQMAADMLAHELNNAVLLESRKAACTLAMHPAVIAAATNTAKADNPQVMALITDAKFLYRASIVYIMNTSGTVVACTPYARNKTLTGNNYAFRPYFKEAMAGKSVVYSALGVTTHKRGLYFSAPIYKRDGQSPVGVVVIKTPLGPIDRVLAKSPVPCAVLSRDGIVLAANRKEWLFKTAFPLPPARKKEIIASKQFATEDLGTLGLDLSGDRVISGSRKQVVVHHCLKPENWQLIMLQPWPSIQPGLLAGCVGTGILLGSIIFAGMYFFRQNRYAHVRLAESEKYYRTIFENTGTATTILAADTTILLANHEYAKLLGAPLEEIEGKMSWTETVVEEDLAMLRKNHKARRVDPNSAPGKYEFRFRDRQGNVKNIMLHISMIPDTDRSVASLLDITELRESEKALIRSEQLAAVGILAGGVAHEFNNINAAALGYAEILLMDKELSEKHRSKLQRIQNACLRAKNLTRSMLSFAGNKGGHKVPTDLNELVCNTLILVEKEFKNEDIKMEMRLGELPTSRMDSAQIGQVLLNLLINAHHAMLGCTDKRITVTTWCENDWLLLSVQDTGIGIPPENIRHVFTPFFSTKGEHCNNDSEQSRIKGNGLGLSVCHTIATQHGGEITVQSTQDEGSTFTLKLPLEKCAIPEHEDRNETFRKANGEHILILDDEPDVRDVLDLMLSKAGYVVQATENAGQALETIREGKVDLLLVDLQMPVLSGVSFLEKLHTTTDIQPPPCLIITGDDRQLQDLDLDKFPAVRGVLPKPFEMTEALERIREILLNEE